jgi:hypothetical protein
MQTLQSISGPADELVQLLGSTGIAALYVFAYVMTAVFLRRWLFHHPAAVAATAAFAMFLIALGCIVPVIIAFATNPTHWDTQGDWWMLLNPVGAMFETNHRGRWTSLQINSLIISFVWANVAFVLNISWYFVQVGAFRPLEDKSAAAVAADVAATADAARIPGAGASSDG